MKRNKSLTLTMAEFNRWEAGDWVISRGGLIRKILEHHPVKRFGSHGGVMFEKTRPSWTDPNPTTDMNFYDVRWNGYRLFRKRGRRVHLTKRERECRKHSAALWRRTGQKILPIRQR